MVTATALVMDNSGNLFFIHFRQPCLEEVFMRFFSYAVLALFIIFSGCMRERQQVGAYTEVAPNSPKVIMAAYAAIEQQQAILSREIGKRQAQMQLLEIQQAEQQVVNGINFRLKLRVLVNKKERRVETIVWWQKWRSTRSFELVSWDFKD
ncbi:MAG: hypothetical protein CSA33_04080 [Desulfobulbus propionicus]|nr:MAG: hypothetical protein CSA33_04080 [Desulfobulbus propionicus]